VIFALVTLDGMQGLEPLIGIAILRLSQTALMNCITSRPSHPLRIKDFQVMPSFGEEAGKQLSVGCEPDTSAARAERFRDGGNDPDVTSGRQRTP
jgi:hypothetical protein